MKIYVGNLSFRATDDSLKDLFSQYGSVTSASIIMDRMSGRSKGFGFVEMDDDAAKTAIAALNDQQYMERKLVVNEARPRVEGERPPRRSFNRGGGGGGRFNRGGGGYGGGDGGY